MLCWKHSFYSVFSKHSFAEIRECKLKNRNLPKIGGCLPTFKKAVFLFVLLCFGALVFSLFLFFLGKKAPKRLVSCNFRGFSSFVPPKGLSLKSFSSSYSVFPCFAFLLPQNSIFFLCVLSINPLLENILFWQVFFYHYLTSPLLMFCLFFERNIPNIHHLKTNLLSFSAIYFTIVFIFVFMFCNSAFLFYVGFVFGYVFLLLLFSVVVLFLVCFQTMKNIGFPALLVFWVMVNRR